MTRCGRDFLKDKTVMRSLLVRRTNHVCCESRLVDLNDVSSEQLRKYDSLREDDGPSRRASSRRFESPERWLGGFWNERNEHKRELELRVDSFDNWENDSVHVKRINAMRKC